MVNRSCTLILIRQSSTNACTFVNSLESNDANLRRVSRISCRSAEEWRTRTWGPRSGGSWCCTSPCPRCANRRKSSTCQSTSKQCLHLLSWHCKRSKSGRGLCPGCPRSKPVVRDRRWSPICRPRISARWRSHSSRTSSPVPRRLLLAGHTCRNSESFLSSYISNDV